MRRRITRALYAAAAAAIALTSFSFAGAGAQAGAAVGSLSPPRYGGSAGYTAEGRWFRFVSTTMTVSPRILPESKPGSGDAIVQLGSGFMPTYPYAEIVVHPGGGPGSIEVSAGAPGGQGRQTLQVSPRVSDQLAVSIYYDRKGHNYFTVSDLTQHTTQTVRITVGKVVYDRALLGGIAAGGYTPPQADTRLWKFAGTRLTTYTGVHGTLTGPWDTTPWIATTSDHSIGTVILSPSGLWNGGANFGVWLRPLPHSYTNELAGYEIYGDLFRFATTTVTVPALLPDSIAAGGAGMRAEIQLNTPASYARIAVTPGGGSGSVTYRAVTATHTEAGVLGLSPAVGDQLKLSLYYDRQGHDFFTATDITQGTTKTVRVTVGSRNYGSVWVMGAIDNNKVTTPPSDIRLWEFTGTHLTTYNGFWSSTILGPWRADEFIDTLNATTSTPVVMSAPVLWDGGQNFGVWLRHH
ncbi:MAG: hypothetical protein ACXVGK_10380 [Mycobacteriaceae bacterium]